MLEIRLFEEKVQELFMQGQIEGTTHLCQGQEAVSVGAVGALEARDYLTITYRGHGHALARGMSMEAAFGELMGRTSGCCARRRRLDAPDRLLPQPDRRLRDHRRRATPSASARRCRRRSAARDAVAMAFCGDGATNIGTFHEALNMASVWKAPVVFVIENNLYGEYSPLRETTPLDDLAERAKAHAMPGVIVDGQDVAAVHETVSTAIARARAGDGPTLIEAKTYRYRGHSRTDPGEVPGRRRARALEGARSRSTCSAPCSQPTARSPSEDAGNALRAEIQDEVDASRRACRRGADPDPRGDREPYVYAN